MAKESKPQPRGSELAVLGVLWESGPSTVRQVHEALGNDRDVRYTTTLKTMQVMVERGLLRRDESRRSHVYSSAVNGKSVRRRLLADLTQRAFGGSMKRLLLRAVQDGGLTREELDELRKFIDGAREGRGEE